MSSSSRKLSPGTIRKRLSFDSHSHGKLPGQWIASTASSGSSSCSRTSSPSCRSSRPVRGKAPGSLPGLPSLQMSRNSSVGSTSRSTLTSELTDTLTSRSKDNVSVTVRFRPLSSRELQKGDQLAWCAEDDTTVRSKLFVATAFAFDRVFDAAISTRQVYDTAAHHVVQGAMEGVNGTVFAYGVTSSGKTHTMHGDQESPGIIPQAIKNVFNIIQEMPGREFLLRVSYLEIYNEVINDLLNPAGQNLRIREDARGTYVEGLKEEVVVSPAHCFSLIAMGEEHRHVGSNNFNLLSSRSHTIFSLTIESSPREQNHGDKEVSFSHLNLIDLAGSESSKTETTGLRRKEGSYINKSLLTLGTVISKLTDKKATHIPYRDSKLTRLLQSSLSGNGLISMICTVTPATSSNEETHNTLKFAHRAKQVEIHALPNKILDEKSLIKKYQREIQYLKIELQQLKERMVESSQPKEVNKEDFANLKQQLEAGQLMLQTRLEEEEQAKAALLGRIERLTKLILVSSKNAALQTLSETLNHRRRHSLNEEELALLPDRRYGSNVGGDDPQLSSDRRSGNMIWDCLIKRETKSKKKSTLARSKHKKRDPSSVTNLDSCNSSNTSYASGSQVIPGCYLQGRKNSVDQRKQAIWSSKSLNSMQAELFSLSAPGRNTTLLDSAVAEQMDLLREQIKVLAGEVAFCITSLKRLSEQAALNSETSQIQMRTLNDELWDKKQKINFLQWSIVENGRYASNNVPVLETSQMLEIDKLKLARDQLREERDTFKSQSLKAAEEASYARELASAASVELGNLAQEVTRLSVQNSNLIAELALAQERAYAKADSQTKADGVSLAFNECGTSEECRTNKRVSEEMMSSYIRREHQASQEGDAALETLLSGKEPNEVEIWQKGKRKGIDLENELAGMWKLVASLKKCASINELNGMNIHFVSELPDQSMNIESMEQDYGQEIERRPAKSSEDCLEEERHHSAELQTLVSQLQIEDLEGLDLATLENLSSLYTEALTRVCRAKARIQEGLKEEEKSCVILGPELCKERKVHVCKV